MGQQLRDQELSVEVHADVTAEIQRTIPGGAEEPGVQSRLARQSPAISKTAAVVVRGARLERLGDFRVLREAGRGGMGVVYEAEQESLGRRVALKVLAAHAIPDPAQVRRFEREARAAAELHHTNIVPVFGVGEQDGLHYYAMQFIAGLGLDNVIEEVKRTRSANPISAPASSLAAEFPENLAGIAPTAAAIARSLVTEQFDSSKPVAGEPSSIHASRPDELGMMIHSPRPMVESAEFSSQVVLGTHGAVVSVRIGCPLLAERGPGRRASRPRPGVRPHAGNLPPRHQALQPLARCSRDRLGRRLRVGQGHRGRRPDKHRRHRGDDSLHGPGAVPWSCDARSDVYALGLTLYEMVALRPAFDQAARQTLIRQVMEAEPPRLRKVSPDVPRDLETVIQKAIAREPASRYATAGALAADLALFLDGKPVRARDTGVRRAVLEVGEAAPRHRRAAGWSRDHRAHRHDGRDLAVACRSGRPRRGEADFEDGQRGSQYLLQGGQ